VSVSGQRFPTTPSPQDLGSPWFNKVTSANTVLKQDRFYPFDPLPKEDEAGALLKGPALRGASRQQEGGDLDIGPQLVTLAVTLPFPAGTQLQEAVELSPLHFKAPSTHTSFACMLPPLLNLPVRVTICPQITSPACTQGSFALKTGAVPCSIPSRPSQGLSHLGGAKLCTQLSRAALGPGSPQSSITPTTQGWDNKQAPIGGLQQRQASLPHGQHAMLGLEGAKVAQLQLNDTSATVWTHAPYTAECKTSFCGLVSLCSLKTHQRK